MPLASLSNLQWNGPASFAFNEDTVPEEPVVQFSGYARNAIDTEAAAETSFRLTMVRSSGMTVDSDSEVVFGWKARGRVDVNVDISARPSAEDIAQAVWGASQVITQQDGSMARAMRLMAAIAANRVVTDPTAGTYTVYDDDDTTVLASGDLWQNAAGTVPYTGSGAERRDRLT